MTPTMVLALPEAENNDTIAEGEQVHLLVFDDYESQRWHWDVACCGASLGTDWRPIAFVKDEGLPVTMFCAGCFANVGQDMQAWHQAAA